MSQLEATGRPKKVEDKSAGRLSRPHAAYTPPPDPLPRLTPFKQESLQRSGSRGSASRQHPVGNLKNVKKPFVFKGILRSRQLHLASKNGLEAVLSQLEANLRQLEANLRQLEANIELS